MRAASMTIAGSEISRELASTLVKKVSSDGRLDLREPTPLTARLSTRIGISAASEGRSRSACELTFLSAMVVLDQALPAGAGEGGREGALAGGGGGYLLGGHGHPAAAFEARPAGGPHRLRGRARLLGCGHPRAPPPGVARHHLPT